MTTTEMAFVSLIVSNLVSIILLVVKIISDRQIKSLDKKYGKELIDVKEKFDEKLEKHRTELHKEIVKHDKGYEEMFNHASQTIREMINKLVEISDKTHRHTSLVIGINSDPDMVANATFILFKEIMDVEREVSTKLHLIPQKYRPVFVVIADRMTTTAANLFAIIQQTTMLHKKKLIPQEIVNEIVNIVSKLDEEVSESRYMITTLNDNLMSGSDEEVKLTEKLETYQQKMFAYNKMIDNSNPLIS